MALVANYTVLSDSSFTLDEGQEYRLMFNPDASAYLQDSIQNGAILMYTVDPSDDALGLQIEVWGRIGGRDRRISYLRVTGTHLRTVTEPFNPEGLTTADNRFWFKVTQGRGSARIHNVVMWYKKAV
jgi:hypothetical protein